MKKSWNDKFALYEDDIFDPFSLCQTAHHVYFKRNVEVLILDAILNVFSLKTATP